MHTYFNWSDEDHNAAENQGWLLSFESDPPTIQKIDYLNIFETDDDAEKWVEQHQTNLICRKAIEITKGNLTAYTLLHALAKLPQFIVIKEDKILHLPSHNVFQVNKIKNDDVIYTTSLEHTNLGTEWVEIDRSNYNKILSFYTNESLAK